MKLKLFIALIFILSCRSGILYSQTWERISEYQLTGNIHSLLFDPYGNFYAASDSGLLCSKDRGVSWTNLFPTRGFDNFVNRVLVINESEILIGAAKGIFYTDDGGLNWRGDLLNIGIDFLVMDKDENIYAGFKPIYKSTDKGQTWNVLKDSLAAWSFYITASGYLLAGTTCGIYLSSDNGNSWRRTGFFDCGDVEYIKGTWDDEVIYIVGADRFRGIYYSTDEGYNWEYVSNSDTVRWGSSIIPVNNNEIYFGSQFNGVFKYIVNDSSLAGFNEGLIYGASAMAYDSLGYLYAAFDGIYRTKSTLDSNKLLRNSVYDYSLAQNYPNPFNSSTIIEYSLKTPGHVKIEIYNLLGENIAEILNAYKSKGNYQVVFNANILASGIYFYQMSVGDFTQIKKMILLR